MVRRARGMRPKRRCLYVTAQQCKNDMEKRVMLKQFNAICANGHVARLDHTAATFVLEDVIFVRAGGQSRPWLDAYVVAVVHAPDYKVVHVGLPQLLEEMNRAHRPALGIGIAPIAKLYAPPAQAMINGAPLTLCSGNAGKNQ